METGRISKVSLAPDGWTAQITFEGLGTPGAQSAFRLDPETTPRLVFEVASAGFDQAGAPVTVLREVVATRVLREPYPNQGKLEQVAVNGDLVVTFALSDYVFAGETVSLDASAGAVTIARSGTTPLTSLASVDVAVTNASALQVAQAKPVANFATPDRQLVTDKIHVEVAAASMFAEAGVSVAAVRFIATDQSGGRVEHLVSAAATSTWGVGDARPITVYSADIPTAGLRDGDLITVRAEVLPHVGEALVSAAASTVGANPTVFADQIYLLDKDNSFGKAFAYVDPDVAAGSGRASADAAAAATTPFRTIGEALVAVQGFNTQAFGRANVDNAEIRLTEGVHRWVGSPVSAASVVSKDVWVTITSDPAASRSQVILTGASDGRNTNAFADFIKIENVTIDRTPMGTSANAIMRGDAGDRLWLDKVVFDGNDQRTGSFLQDNIWVTQSDLNEIGSAFSSFSSLTNGFKFRGVTADSGPGATMNGNLLIGSDTHNVETRFFKQPTALDADGAFIGYNRMTDDGAATFVDVARLQSVEGFAIVGNSFTAGLATQPALSLSGDSHFFPVSNLVVQNNIVTGARVNVGYNDIADQNHVKTLLSLENNTLQQLNTKHDVFSLDSDNTGGWAALYGVGSKNNTVIDPPASRNFNLEFDGIGTTVAGQVRHAGVQSGVVTEANAAPVAASDAYAMLQADMLTVAAAGVLANDRDADGDALSAALGAGPTSGALTLNPDGSFVYTPREGFVGIDRFTYRAGDGDDTSDLTNVAIQVIQRTDRPIALDDTGFSAAFGTSLRISLSSLLANDQNATGGTLSVTSVSGVVNGAAVLSGDAVLFTPAAGFTGEASFTYTLTSSTRGQDTARVAVSVGFGPPGGDFTILIGTEGDDRSFASKNGRDYIDGKAGADWIDGRGGDDFIIGGMGRDTLVGGAGNDTMLGGVDGDQFRFDGRVLVGTETDLILDLNFAEGDALSFSSFAAGTFRAQAGGNPLSIISSGSGVIVDSVADLIELSAQSPAVWATEDAAAPGRLTLWVRDADNDQLALQLNGALTAYLNAGGALLV